MPADQSPATVPFQPEPVMTRVVRFKLFGWVVTAIMRHWKPGDSGPGSRCRLCPLCKAYGDGCLIVVGRNVSDASAPLFSSVRAARQPGKDAARVVVGNLVP